MPINFREIWEIEWQVDFAFFLEQAGRFRANAFLQRGSLSFVFRHIKSKMPTFEDLNLYKDTLKQSIEAKDGIVLVCVSTGSVKSTTIACMLNYLNDLAEKHVMTL